MERKYTLTISILVIIVIVISIVFSSNNNPPEMQQIPGLTALEAKPVADKLVEPWSIDPFLLSAQGYDMGDNGTFHSWFFFYGKWNYMNQLKGFGVSIYSNGTNRTRLMDGRYYYNPVVNVTVDSDDAFNIALTNDSLQDFIKGNNTDFNGMILNKKSHNITWKMDWLYTIPGDPYYNVFAKVSVNAQTGEIEYVHIEDYW